MILYQNQTTNYVTTTWQNGTVVGNLGKTIIKYNLHKSIELVAVFVYKSSMVLEEIFNIQTAISSEMRCSDRCIKMTVRKIKHLGHAVKIKVSIIHPIKTVIDEKLEDAYLT